VRAVQKALLLIPLPFFRFSFSIIAFGFGFFEGFVGIYLFD